ncbi:MAG: right-handed parallel beta-helix repeat-containing protein, partial [Promethearchaeota archaeon]
MPQSIEIYIKESNLSTNCLQIIFYSFGEMNMNSKVKLKIKILIILGILFSLSPMISTNLSFIRGNSRSSEYSDNFNMDNKNLQPSKVSAPIYIDDTDPNYNWSVAKDAGICTGNGTYSEPYVIENATIEAQGGESCIYVQNSNAYFIIQNCSLYNIEIVSSFDAGIALNNVANGKIVNNYCYSNFLGIYLYQSNNNIVSGNNVHNNNDDGIFLRSSNDNTVLGNNISN